MIVGLVLGREGFPKAHEVFEGNRSDTKTVEEILTVLEKRTGKMVVVDRGMAFGENLKQIVARGYHYLVASPQGERNEHLDEFEEEEGWQEVVRKCSPTNLYQKKSRVFIKQKKVGEEIHILCRSEGREERDRAIRQKQEERFLEDIKKLQRRIAGGKLVVEAKIHQAIGRLKERYPRVARYYVLAYNEQEKTLSLQEHVDKKEKAKLLDGSYVLKTNRHDLSEGDIWHTYTLLTRVEAAFRAMKSPLMERPIFHQLKHRVQTHIFLCVLAYHLLVAIENSFLYNGIHISWGTLREELSTHQVATVVLPTKNGRTLRIRKGTTPEKEHKEIYKVLGITNDVMKPIRTWNDS